MRFSGIVVVLYKSNHLSVCASFNMWLVQFHIQSPGLH